MSYLNLGVHDRDEYEGKLVDCHGATYVVGGLLGVGAERVVHSLINQQSGLSFLVIKVLKQPRPRGLYTRQIAHLRTDPALARVIPVTLEVDVPGGMVELQPNAGASSDPDPAADAIAAGYSAMSSEVPALDAAIGHFEAVLAQRPFHSEALYGLAHAQWRQDRPFDAFFAIDKAAQIEPNLLRYRLTQIELALATQQAGYALDLFVQFERDFADVHDLDELGARVLSHVGQPDAALRRIASAMVSDVQRAELRREAEIAVAARGQALAMMAGASEHVYAGRWEAAASALLEAQRIYNRDPELCMNTAFAAIHSGDLRVCAGLMLHASSVVSDALQPTCSANAGFALLLSDEFAGAMDILKITARRLQALHGAIPESPDDLPGVGIWIDDDGLREEPTPVAADVLEQGLKRAAAVGVAVPELVHALARAYRVAASMTN